MGVLFLSSDGKSNESTRYRGCTGSNKGGSPCTCTDGQETKVSTLYISGDIRVCNYNLNRRGEFLPETV